MAQAKAIEIRQQATSDGAILFDAGLVAQAEFSADWFEPEYWRTQNAARLDAGGRGGVAVVQSPHGAWVLRHYRRGGMVARVMGDRYLWSGAERTRGFAELRLLAELNRRGLDVPRPVAARYQRHGAHYRADLITQFIDGAQTLAQRLRSGDVDARAAQRVGSAVARVHNEGAYHADLNAHNVLLDAQRVWLLDFDRGELRTPQRAWQLDNLARMRRSLVKLGAAQDGERAFD
ncbi:MAG: 3-deoxy-D-manno-octulosonic acid kinase, partial [Gammaproteobacteria bacterium]